MSDESTHNPIDDEPWFTCVGCNVTLTEEDYCFGCGGAFCEDCEVLVPTAHHDPEDHLRKTFKDVLDT